MNVLDLFSGIGGFSLGLERAGGFDTVAFCEIEPYCQAVLRKHWPDVPIYTDITKLDGRGLRGRADVICGGFPCQDISAAGKGAGITGSRSGLWAEYARIIDEVRPRYVIVENVAMLLSRGLGRVLGDLASLGYDAEWHCIPAAAIGAPHRRDRIWIVAYPGCIGSTGRRTTRDMAGAARTGEGDGQERQRHGDAPDDSCADVADTDKPRLERWFRKILRERASQRAAWASGSYVAYPSGERCREEGQLRSEQPEERSSCGGEELADAPSDGRNARRKSDTTEIERGRQSDRGGSGEPMADPYSIAAQWFAEPRLQRDPWFVEPAMGRVANGIPSRVDRLKCLGNAIVPQIAEIIGQAIMTMEATTRQ